MLALFMLFAFIDPSLITSMDINFTHSGSVYVEDGYFSHLSLELHVPFNTLTKQVWIESEYPYKIKTVNGSKLLLFDINREGSLFNYEYSGRVVSKNEVYNGGGFFTGDRSFFTQYLSSTEHIIVDDQVRSLALNITSEGGSDIYKIYKLAEWVNSYLEYYPEYAGENIPSDRVLKDPKGVCTEFTNLFAALSRSLGYPTRIVIGYVYLPDEGWMFHSWAQVYLDRWVDVDPTWLEVGYLDATHIPIAYSEDTSFKDRISAITSSDSSGVKWESDQYFGRFLSGIEINSVNETPLDLEIYYEPKELNPGDQGYFIGYINSDSYRVLDLPVIVCNGEPPIVLINSTNRFFLQPGMNSFYIPFEINGWLDPEYVYKCPVVVGDQVFNFTVSGKRSYTKSYNAFSSIRVNTSVAYVEPKEKDLTLKVYPYNNFAYSLNLDNTTSFDYDNWVIISDGDDATLLVSNYKKQGITYRSVNFSSVAYVDYPINLTMEIYSEHLPYRIDVFKDDIIYDSFTIKDPQSKVIIPLTFHSKGYHSITLNVTNDEYIDTRTFPVNVIDPELVLNYSCDLWGDCVLFYAGLSEGYTSESAYLDGLKVVLPARIKPGDHQLVVNWVDLNGYPHTSKRYFEVKDGKLYLVLGILVVLGIGVYLSYPYIRKILARI